MTFSSLLKNLAVIRVKIFLVCLIPGLMAKLITISFKHSLIEHMQHLTRLQFFLIAKSFIYLDLGLTSALFYSKLTHTVWMDLDLFILKQRG